MIFLKIILVFIVTWSHLHFFLIGLVGLEGLEGLEGLIIEVVFSQGPS